MTTDNLANRPHDYEMTLASARSAAHAFLNPIDHRQHEPRSQHRPFRTTIMELKLYFNLHQYLPGQNLPSFCQQPAIHNHCYQNFWELVKPPQQKGQSEPTTGYIQKSICLWLNSNCRTESQRIRRHHITSNEAIKRRLVRGWCNFQQKVCWFAKNSTVNNHKHNFSQQTA